MQFTTKLVVALSLAATTMVSSARAQSYEYAHEDTGRDHRGFFLRASAGLGYSGMFASEEYLGVDYTYSIGGISSLWNFAVGGSVTERLALHFVYFGGSAFSPTVTVEGDGVSSSDNDLDTTMTLHNLGGGITYYTRSNFYFGAQLGLAFATLSDFDTGDSDTIGPGIAVGGIFGKEWFVTRQLGIGVAGQLNFTRVTDDSDEETPWIGVSGGPMFSLTYN